MFFKLFNPLFCKLFNLILYFFQLLSSLFFKLFNTKTSTIFYYNFSVKATFGFMKETTKEIAKFQHFSRQETDNFFLIVTQFKFKGYRIVNALIIVTLNHINSSFKREQNIKFVSNSHTRPQCNYTLDRSVTIKGSI